LVFNGENQSSKTNPRLVLSQAYQSNC
ncbi:hypothetical protein F8388_024129, partial [Cannabis sativa]